jgi:hypothetical protein
MIPMSIVLMRSKLLFLRYALPFIPIIVILAARLIGLTADKFIKRDWRLAFSVILLVIIGFDPAFRSIQNTILLTKKDTRTFAMEWIGQHIPAKTVIRVHGYPYARPELPRGYRYQEETLENLKAIEGEYWFLHHEYPIKFFSPPMKPSFVDYFNTIGEIVFEISPFTPGKEVKQGYDLSDAFYLPLSGFSNVERPGPIIRIYKVHSKPSDPL